MLVGTSVSTNMKRHSVQLSPCISLWSHLVIDLGQIVRASLAGPQKILNTCDRHNF